jgi:L-arabinonolactonase
MTAVDLVAPTGCTIGESPVWDEKRQCLFWVDIYGDRLLRYDPGPARLTALRVPGTLAAIALRPAGDMICGLKPGFALLDPDTGRTTPLHAPERDRPGNRLNEGKCDPRGRFWCGSMNEKVREPTGALYRFDAARCCVRILDDIIVPNGLAWSLDGRQMYFADSRRHRIDLYDFDADAGRLGARRHRLDTTAHPGIPDGSTIDSDGCLWNAEFGGGRIVRYRPDLTVDRVIAMPVTQINAIAFGGADLDILFVTTSRRLLSEDQLARQPLAGGLFALRPGVGGLPADRYLG